LLNISAVHYELGNYTKVIEDVRQALSLIPVANNGAMSKAILRASKAHVHLKQYDQANKLLERLGESTSKAEIERCVTLGQESEAAKTFGLGVRNLPHYKPAIAIAPDCFNVGNDDAMPLFDHLLISNTSASETITYFFGGIGDARHLFQTIRMIWAIESESVNKGRVLDQRAEMKKCNYHFTVNDINGCALARHLLVLLLLEEIADAVGNTAPDQVNKPPVALVTLFFLYVGYVMPTQNYEYLQQTISRALQVLTVDVTLPGLLFVYNYGRESIITALQQWQKAAADAFPADNLVSQAKATLQRLKETGLKTDVAGMAPDGCHEELQYWIVSGLLLPPDDEIPRALKRLLKMPMHGQSATNLKHYIEQNWKPNATLADMNNLNELKQNVFAVHDPFWQASMPYACIRIGNDPENPQKLYDYLAPFFVHTAQAVRGLAGRLHVEMMTGDVTVALGRITKQDVKDRPKHFPQRYNRIHLSNIPDYVGGSLFTYIHVLPLLKDKPSSFALANNCRNAPAFPSIEAFNSEYTTVHTDRDLVNLLGAKTISLNKIDNILLQTVEGVKYPMPRYHAYQRTQGDLSLCSEVEHWLYAIFLQIALPASVSEMGSCIYSPLNLTIFFRLISRLHELGYPAHWLSEVISAILSNQVHTTARFPCTSPLTVEESDRKHSRMHIDIAPFIPEFSALTAMWMYELPFGIAALLSTPKLSSMKRYTIRFTKVTDQEKNLQPSIPALTVLFTQFDARLAAMDVATRVPDFTLRKALMAGDQGYQDDVFVKLRQKSVVITTWTWDREKKTAGFWFDAAMMDRMLAERPAWSVNILRMNYWKEAAVTDVLNLVLSTGESWEMVQG
jgi:tetratricopeptide (TPR) repeat protein